MVGDADELQAVLFAGCQHLTDRIVRMPAGKRVHMDIE